jgi:uncharacterized membrane protein YeiH
MPVTADDLRTSIIIVMYLGDIVFAVSGALTAARHRMDVLGYVMIGTVTGIGGGTTRDLLLGRTVWWTQNPLELVLCISAALATFFWVTNDISRAKWMIWLDALGLSVFGVVGCHVALDFGVPFIVAVFMGMVTATGGGLIRDVLTNTKPLIMRGELYASAALVGSLSYATLARLAMPDLWAEGLAILAAFSLRAAAIVFNIQMGPPGEFVRIGRQARSGEGSP